MQRERGGRGGGGTPAPTAGWWVGRSRCPGRGAAAVGGWGGGGGALAASPFSPLGRESHGNTERVRTTLGLADVDLQACHAGRGGPGGLALRGRRLPKRSAGRSPGPLRDPSPREPSMRAGAAPAPFLPARRWGAGGRASRQLRQHWAAWSGVGGVLIGQKYPPGMPLSAQNPPDHLLLRLQPRWQS